jgi:hypothetical protein
MVTGGYQSGNGRLPMDRQKPRFPSPISQVRMVTGGILLSTLRSRRARASCEPCDRPSKRSVAPDSRQLHRLDRRFRFLRPSPLPWPAPDSAAVRQLSKGRRTDYVSASHHNFHAFLTATMVMSRSCCKDSSAAPAFRLMLLASTRKGEKSSQSRRFITRKPAARDFLPRTD